ncbi:MAG TPA: aldehyde dehydrogenase family protein [Thermoanaerobaculia bacterium]|nr:aldehyde dehydrogenase family protein [Thermoanaerobaculia bacterium]
MDDHRAFEAGLWIDGRPVASRFGEPAAVFNPATGEVLARVAQAGPEDVGAAVDAADRAWRRGDWRRATVAERARVLLRLAERIREGSEELAALESRNVGKPLTEARGEIEMGAACFQYYAGLIPAFGGRTVPVSAPGTGLTFREPVGVCGLIVPWNFPFAITTWKVAPALALGNYVVVKPASTTPLSALRLAELAAEAGLPPGVLNVVPGPGGAAGSALARHPDVRKISFTGSTEVGSEVMRAAAADVKRVSLELGGKSASLIFADADLEKAGASISGSFGNAGQDCCARSRVLVERPVYEEVVERFVARVRALRVGDPMDAATEIGSLISKAHRDKVDGWVRRGVEQGATLCTGGRPLAGGSYDRGSFYEPAVFRNVSPEMAIAQEEIFGPVVAILPFDTEEEAIRLANGTIYGLSGSLWTRDLGRAMRVVRAIETGVISVNTSWSVHLEMPFGGVKRSGVGRELGPSALDHYSEWKSVFIADS